MLNYVPRKIKKVYTVYKQMFTLFLLLKMDQKIIICGESDKQYIIDKRGLGAFIFDACSRYGNKTFQIMGNSGESETYANFKKRTTRLAKSLKNLGINQNDTIAVCSYNTLDTIVPVVASLFIGAIVTAFDPITNIDEQKHLVKMTKPKLIFTQRTSYKIIEECVTSNNLNSTIVVMEDEVFQNMLEEQDDEKNFTPIVLDSRETAFIFFSSGSTGLPKGICVSHYALLFSIENQLNKGYSQQFGFLSIYNIYWAVEITVVLMAIRSGGYRVIVDEYCTHPKYLIEPIEKYKVTFALLSPATTRIFESHTFDKYNLKHFETLVVSGSKVTIEKLNELGKQFPYTNVMHSYGTTEVLHVFQFHLKRDQELFLRKPTSVGKLSNGISAKIVDLQTNLCLGPNKEGELYLKSPSIMNGYYLNEESNLDEFGFCKTGDLAYYDEEECFYIDGRIKELFKFKGCVIKPYYLEHCLIKHEAVKETVVFGVPHELGEIPSALVTIKEGYTIKEDDLLQFANGQLKETDKLDKLRIVGELPKTCTNKIVRSKAREIFINMTNNRD